ncbi:MAG: heme lyase NrfEFG subunit NrfE, partial [Pseudomonadota bacterium]|nr:heme lyase NrfEFG subunit NrfE [Pseudomonadota bacterium]
MIAEWSHLALALAVPLVGLQLLLAFLPAAPLGLNDARRARAVRGTAVLGAGLISLSFLGLIASFVAGDFSVKTAFEHSHSAKPLLYKISGTWGNHEGSILLWVLILSLFGGLLALTGRGGEARGAASALITHALGVQALVTLA